MQISNHLHGPYRFFFYLFFYAKSLCVFLRDIVSEGSINENKLKDCSEVPNR